MKLVAIVFLISFVIDATFANTAKIDFSKEASSKQVKDAVLGIKIPDQSGKEKGINYRVSRIKITGFSVGSAFLHDLNSLNYRLALDGVHMSATGRIDASKTIGWWKFKKTIRASVDLTIKFKHVRINQGASIRSVGGKIRAYPTTCSADIKSVDVKSKGNDLLGKIISGIFNVIKGLFGGKIKSSLEDKICPTIRGPLSKYMANLDLAQIFQG